MATTSYRVGKLRVNPQQEPSVKTPASQNKPPLTISVNRLPDDPGRSVTLSCVPTAFWNAFQMAGLAIYPGELEKAKLAELEALNRSTRNSRTKPDEFGRRLVQRRLDVDFRVIKRGSAAVVTMKDAVKRLLAAGYRTGVILTKTPAHAWAIQISPTGASCHIVDNGGWGQDVASWRGGNITGVYGIRPKAPPKPVAKPHNHSWSRQGRNRSAPAACRVEHCGKLRCQNGADFIRCRRAGTLRSSGLVICGSCVREELTIDSSYALPAAAYQTA